MTDAKLEIHLCEIVSDELIKVTYKSKTDFVEEGVNTSCLVALWTTSMGRLKLYEDMEKIGENVLYFDTDSIIYTYYDEPVATGDYLGDLTDELGGDFITKYVSCGPKQYSYVTSQGKNCVKIRGFTLDYTGAKLLTFEALKKAVDCYMNRMPYEVTLHFPQIVKNSKHKVTTQQRSKCYKYVYDKCAVQSNYVTLPFGY